MSIQKQKEFKDYPFEDQMEAMKNTPLGVILYDNPPREAQKLATEADIRSLELITDPDPMIKLMHEI